MEPLDVTQLRAFLAGDTIHLQHKETEWGYLDGTLAADPGWLSPPCNEIIDRDLTSGDGRARNSLKSSSANIASVASVSARLSRGSFFERVTVHFWLVDEHEDGRPFAEVPWGNTVNKQAIAAGLPVR